jgi:predicted TIM-barrel fold metal-dependent hydrolase
MQEQDAFKGLAEYVNSLPVFSDHEHHLPDAFFARKVTLDELVNSSYVSWTGHRLDGGRPAREALLEHTRFNSYFTWFERGLARVHGIDVPLTVENWETISARVGRTYGADQDFHWRVLKDHGYERQILDSYWNPGDDNGHPEIFVPTFRIDKFMYGTHAESVAPDDFVPWQRYGFSGGELEDWVELMRRTIRTAAASGRAVALKCAEAYCRTVDFQPDDAAAARRAFGVPFQALEPQSQVLFGNYIFNRCCELAEELNLPFQIHTGLAKLATSQPLNFEPTIQRYPRVRFVMFHAGYPWTHQAAGLAHNYANAYPSLTWLVSIAPSVAVRTLHEFIEVACSINTITWGSDAWTTEESVGALLAWRWVVAKTLAQRLADGLLTARDAECLARKLMYENGRQVYGVGG